jgi:RIO kinase 1
MYLEGVLLMELVLDAGGEAAPRVIDTALTPQQANAAYFDMLAQLARILSCDLIHGDLSPYNVLWGASGPTIIDFPQIVSASHNSRSEVFFMRDARNILGYFAGIDRSLLSRGGDASQIWHAYVRRELTPDFMPSARARPPLPRPRPVEPARPSRPHVAPAPPRHNSGNNNNHRHPNNPPPRRPPGPEVFVRVRGATAAPPAERRDERLIAATTAAPVVPVAVQPGAGPAGTPPNPPGTGRRRRRRRR